MHIKIQYIAHIDVTFDRLAEKPCETSLQYKFFQLQFPPSRICQCRSRVFVNGLDEYLSISLLPHITQRYEVSFITLFSLREESYTNANWAKIIALKEISRSELADMDF